MGPGGNWDPVGIKGLDPGTEKEEGRVIDELRECLNGVGSGGDRRKVGWIEVKPG